MPGCQRALGLVESDILEVGDCRARIPMCADGGLGKAWPTAGEYLDAIEANLRQGFPDLLIPGAAEYMDALDYQLTLAYAGQKSAQDALNDAAKEWRQITKRLGFEEQKKAWLAQLKAMRAMGVVK